MPTTLNNEAAIVGIGETEYSKNSGRSELALASEAVAAAIRDAGLSPSDIDGMTTFTMDTSCLLYTSPSPRDATLSRMPSSA